jgi:hypothetical protein
LPELPEGLWRELVAQLIEAAPTAGGEDGAGSSAAGSAGIEGADVAALAERLGGEARGALLALAIEDAPEQDELVATTVLEQILVKLRALRLKQAHSTFTESHRDLPSVDDHTFLAAKQRQLEERRAARSPLGLPPDGRR